MSYPANDPMDPREREIELDRNSSDCGCEEELTRQQQEISTLKDALRKLRNAIVVEVSFNTNNWVGKGMDSHLRDAIKNAYNLLEEKQS